MKKYKYITVLGEIIPPLLNADMVAKELTAAGSKKVTRHTVITWVNRGKFPEPAIEVGSTRLWTWKQIKNFLEGELSGQDFENREEK